MIVFIATVLVAATAAAVMIDTAGQLQSQASRSGDESTRAVANSLYLKGVFGKRDTTSASELSTLNVTISLSPSADAVDLSGLVVRISDGQTSKDLTYDGGATGEGRFSLTVPRDDDGSYSVSAPVLTSGDLANVQINLTNQGLSLTPRTDVSLTLQVEAGLALHAGFSTPATYGTKQVVILT